MKKKIAIEAIREQRTINEIAAAYEVHPVQVRKWKKELLDGAADVFENPSKQRHRQSAQDEQTARLEQKIGQLAVENDWLKKSSITERLRKESADRNGTTLVFRPPASAHADFLCI